MKLKLRQKYTLLEKSRKFLNTFENPEFREYLEKFHLCNNSWDKAGKSWKSHKCPFEKICSTKKNVIQMKSCRPPLIFRSPLKGRSPLKLFFCLGPPPPNFFARKFLGPSLKIGRWGQCIIYDFLLLV